MKYKQYTSRLALQLDRDEQQRRWRWRLRRRQRHKKEKYFGNDDVGTQRRTLLLTHSLTHRHTMANESAATKSPKRRCNVGKTCTIQIHKHTHTLNMLCFYILYSFVGTICNFHRCALWYIIRNVRCWNEKMVHILFSMEICLIHRRCCFFNG